MKAAPTSTNSSPHPATLNVSEYRVVVLLLLLRYCARERGHGCVRRSHNAFVCACGAAGSDAEDDDNQDDADDE